ncbi:MAG: PD40 domain-containing protein [Bacteroidales bacterium]|nr:PD40 domain-containing protein [Bacteroidales bacterium]
MRLIALFILVVLFISCNNNKKYKFEYDVIITDTAANLKDLNSEYDDYNSDLPYPAQRMDIYFSSNRNSRGHNFDIVAGKMDFSYHSDDDILNASTPTNVYLRDALKILPKINTDNNEFGPYTYYSGDDILFMYATEVNGSFDIKFVEFTNWNYSHKGQEVSNPLNLGVINDIGDNLYPSINHEKDELFFCSNRNDTVFNIYSASFNTVISKQSLIDGNINAIEINNILSSSYDDKCPYISGDFLIFTSNRDGGFGGYDLWFSQFKNNSWTNPTNFGENINSKYDEFRPVMFNTLNFDLMIFSSNRPKGKGGFDLYIVKIDEFKD